MIRLEIYLPVSGLGEDRQKAVESIKAMVESVFAGSKLRWSHPKQSLKGTLLLVGRIRRTDKTWAQVVVQASEEDIEDEDPRVDFDAWGTGRFLNWGDPKSCRLQLRPEESPKVERGKESNPHDNA